MRSAYKHSRAYLVLLATDLLPIDRSIDRSIAMSKRITSATSRLRQDYMRIKRDPVPYIVAEPLPSNILEWHYVVTGPETR